MGSTSISSRWTRATIAACASITLASCAALPMTEAETSCRTVFQAIREKANECGFEMKVPNEEQCEDAYSYDPESLNGDCLPYLRAIPCDGGMTTEEFRAHCGRVIDKKWW